LQKELGFENSQEGGYFLDFFHSYFVWTSMSDKNVSRETVELFFWLHPATSPLPKTKKSNYPCFTWNNMHLADKFSIFCWKNHIISVKKSNKPLL